MTLQQARSLLPTRVIKKEWDVLLLLEITGHWIPVRIGEAR